MEKHFLAGVGAPASPLPPSLHTMPFKVKF